MVRKPPDILITTPESLYLLLTSQARETLRGIETVIVDEVHAVAGTKRGAHLALSLERLDRLAGEADPADRAFGDATPPGGDRPLRRRRARDRARRRRPREGARPEGGRPARRHARARGAAVDLAVDLPGDPRARPRASLDDRVRQQPPSGGAAGAALNDLAEEEIARAHHGSLAREQRVEVEELLKKGEIPCLVATSSLELGIDMGAVDLVIQVESPKSVARGLQRVGRAGHELGRGLEGPHLPEVPGRPARVGGGRPPHARRRDRGDEDPAQPARRARPADRGDLRRRGDQGRRAARARARRLPLRRPLARPARERARHARRSLPVGRVRRAAGARRVGSHRRRRQGPPGREAARGHERGHDPGPRALRRPPRGRRRPRGRARRGDGLRGSRGADVPARSEHVADRGDHPRPRARLAGSGGSGRGAVLEGRGGRPALRAG